MTERSRSVVANALALSPLERAEVIDQVYRSLRTEREREVESAWAQESERRIDAYLAGDAKTIPYDQVKRHANSANSRDG